MFLYFLFWYRKPSCHSRPQFWTLLLLEHKNHGVGSLPVSIRLPGSGYKSIIDGNGFFLLGQNGEIFKYFLLSSYQIPHESITISRKMYSTNVIHNSMIINKGANPHLVLK